MIIDPADLIAIHRALEMAGREGARAELLCRFPAVRYDRVESALDYILAAPVEIPDVRRDHRRPFPGPKGRPRKRSL